LSNKIVILILFSLLLYKSIKAQAVFDTLYLNEFEIIAIKDDYRKSFKETTIDTLIRKEFEHYNLGQLLSAFSPVFIKSYGKGSISTASFRGTSASHTQVLWNDFPVNSPMLGQVDFSYIPDAFFDDVKLLFGGGSLAKQSGALGGTILINNFSENKNKPLIHINQSIGSFNTYNTSAGINYGNKNFHSETKGILQTSKNDFKYYNNGIIPPEWMFQKNASYLNCGFQQQFTFKKGKKNSFNFISWNQWNNRNIPPIMTNIYQGGNPKEFQNTFFSRNILGWNLYNNKTEITVKTAWFFENQHYYLKTTTNNDSSTVSLIDSKSRLNGIYLKSEIVHKFKYDWTLKVNAGLAFDKVNSNNYESSKNRTSTTLSIFTEKTFLKRLTFDFLIRTELSDGDVLPIMPFAGTNFKLFNTEALFFRFTISRNFHLPTLNDLYWYPGGNSDLLPEKGLQLDGGINYLKSFKNKTTLSFDFTAFYSGINNWIQWAPSDYHFWTPENVSFVKSRGIELSTKLNGELLNKLSYMLSLKYALTKTTDESIEAVEGGYSGRQLIYIPVNHGNLFVYIGYKSWNVSWSTLFTGYRNTNMNPNDGYSNQLPYYSLNSIQTGKSWIIKENIATSVNLKINNLFNIQYQAVLWRAMPGINFELSIKLDFK
jgi:iron complex outermembrane receptor protein